MPNYQILGRTYENHSNLYQLRNERHEKFMFSWTDYVLSYTYIIYIRPCDLFQRARNVCYCHDTSSCISSTLHPSSLIFWSLCYCAVRCDYLIIFIKAWLILMYFVMDGCVSVCRTLFINIQTYREGGNIITLING